MVPAASCPIPRKETESSNLFKHISPGFSRNWLSQQPGTWMITQRELFQRIFNNYLWKINECWVDDTVILGKKRTKCSLEPGDGDGHAIGPKYFTQGWIKSKPAPSGGRSNLTCSFPPTYHGSLSGQSLMAWICSGVLVFCSCDKTWYSKPS